MFPRNAEAGGVESLFQGCDSINENGGNAWMVYDGTIGDAVPEKYKCYANVKILPLSQIDRHKNNLVILPEVWTDRIPEFFGMRVAIWWLSVDNNHGKFKDFVNPNILHLYQSEYANHFLRENGATNVLPLRDYILGFNKTEVSREDLICFNPAKGIQNTQYIVNNTPNTIKFVGLSGMSKNDMVNTLSRSKIYIDFGHHPGRDRIPREAASLGCLIVTSCLGSAGNRTDIPIDDKYKIRSLSPNIGTFLHSLIDNYNEEVKNFDYYRMVISSDKNTLAREVRNVIDYVSKGD